MTPRRTAVLSAMAVAAAVLVAPSTAASTGAAPQAGPSPDASPQAGLSQGEWVCVVTDAAPDRERTRRLPSMIVDRLIERTRSYRGPCAEYGENAELGDGELTAYSQSVGSRPVSVGLLMSDDSLEGLPHDPPNDDTWCYDKDGDGSIDPATECAGGYERQLDLGKDFQRTVDSPYTYVLANWNPHGHVPPGVYDLPHFDVHFYVNEDAERTAIRPGPCPQLVHCDDYELAKKLPAEEYLAPDYEDMDAVEPAMGNHLADPTGPEFNGERFTHTWIYGVWDREVTFYEAMVTHEWLDGMRGGSIADGCHDFKLPEAWQESGWYPTSYCMRHRENRDELTVSLENFVYRSAS